MKKLIFIFAALVLSSCEQGSDIASVTPKADPTGRKRGQTNTCPTYVDVNMTAANFNITADTSICGMVVFRWDPQAGFNPVTDTCYTTARYYYINIAPVGHTNGCIGGGSISSTNTYYYTMGAGCSIFPSYTYSVSVSYVEHNNALQKNIWHYSTPITFTAGTRAPWLNNCN